MNPRAHADCIPQTGCLVERSDECPYTDTPASHFRTAEEGPLSPGMVSVPLMHVEILRDLRGQVDYLSTTFKASLDALIECIPEPAYEPDPAVVMEFAITTGTARRQARETLVMLHKRGLTVTQTEPAPSESKE